MKVLIWIGCIIGASFVQLLLGLAGIGGAIPAMAVFSGMFASASFLCKKYDEKRSRRSAADTINRESRYTDYAAEQEENILTKKTVVPPIIYCRKCGKKLIEDSDFCSYCGTAIVKEWEI